MARPLEHLKHLPIFPETPVDTIPAGRLSLPYKKTDGKLYALGENGEEILTPYQNLTSDPASPAEGDFWYNATDKVFRYYDGTAVQTLPTLQDFLTVGRYRGAWDATAGIPTAADSVNHPGTAIVGGDYWRVSVAGTITGLTGEAELEVNDLIYANVDGAATAAQFFGANTNVDINEDADQKVEEKLGINLTGGTPRDVAATDLGAISSYLILQGTKDITSAFEVDVDDDTPKISISSFSNYTGLTVKLLGTCA